jgi:hypothetical protein
MPRRTLLAAVPLVFRPALASFDPDWTSFAAGDRAADHPLNCSEVSNALGSGMVLQQAPTSAVVWGTACGGLANVSSVSVTLLPEPYDAGLGALVAVTVPVVEGRWNASLPPVGGGFDTYTVVVEDGQRQNGFHQNLTGVLFGEVVLCSGQVRR